MNFVVINVTGGITCESTVRDITSGMSGKSIVISTVMDITGSITCELWRNDMLLL